MQRIPANYSVHKELIYPALSFKITGLCFQTHNELGRFGREKQYANTLEQKIIAEQIGYKRELKIGNSGNVVDFLIDDKLILELKTKPFITKEDYFQVQRYLHQINIKLGLIINFRNRFLQPKRVIYVEKYLAHS